MLTNGCFDLLHVGHLKCLEDARRLGDLLIVAINSDASVRRLKGAGRPIIGQSARAAMLAALRCVDHVLVFDEDTPHRILRVLRPAVLAKGGGYSCEEIVGGEIVREYGGLVTPVGHVPGVSTSLIADTISRTPKE